MADSTQQSAERRHSPRFACAGRVSIASLPMEDGWLPAKLRDLSLGGCCLETPHPLRCGTRAELLLQVNAVNFRALGEVRTIRGCAAGLQFLRLTETGNSALKELLADAARFHAAVTALRSARGRQESELWLRLSGTTAEPAKLQRYPVFRRILAAPRPSETPDAQEEEGAVVSPSENICLVSLDLFV